MIMWKKLYTTAEWSGNAADHLANSENLFSFAAKNAMRHFHENGGSEAEPFGWVQDIASAVTVPFTFLYYLVTGPLLYRYDALPIEIEYDIQEKGKFELRKIVSKKGKLMVIHLDKESLFFYDLEVAKKVFSDKGIVLKSEEKLEDKL